MRSTTISLIVVTLLAMGLCAFSLHAVRGAVGEVDELRVRAVEQARAGDAASSGESLAAIAGSMQRARGTLEMITSHDDLHEVMLQIAEARVYLEFGEMVEFYRVLALMGETLGNIRATEEITFGNLY